MPNQFLQLFWDTGVVAKLILFVLLAASILCWAIIIGKWKKLKRVHAQDKQFIKLFWSGKSIDEVAGRCEKFPESTVASVFRSGVRELQKFGHHESTSTSQDRLENINRALQRTASSEVASLEKDLNWLATTASAAPFIGLFGTVWGIMNSFQSIGATGAANLAVVAPGIAEALITTATGIAAAVPAVIAYNTFVGQIKKVATEVDCFTQDFINILQRSFTHSNRKG